MTTTNQNPIEELTFAELFNRFGVDEFDTPLEIDTSTDGYEVESWDARTQQTVWKPINALVIKPSVSKHYRLGTLKGTAVHRVLHNGEWVELQNHPTAVLVEEPMTVVDMMVEDTENYLAEGQINHNTTPGGMAIPYHASVRLKITGGQQLKKTINGKEAVIGIEVEVKTIKNKVARPWRQIGFEIHFGKGIYEDEHVLTEIARYCRESKEPVLAGKDNSRRVSLETGAWNTFTIADNNTGEVIEEVKFRKSDFGSEVLRNPKYTEYVDALFDACYIMRSDTHATVTGIDTESATELEAARLEASGKQLLND